MNIFQVILIQPLTNGLILFYKICFSNMGIAIIAFALFLRFITNPLTKPYMQSMKKMKEFEPQLSKLKEKYRNDKKMLLQAQTDFYKQKGINPAGGCLPYLLQIVILIALFNVFTKVLAGGDIGANLNSLLYEPLRFENGADINKNFLYLDITKPDVFRIPGLPFPLPGPILILAAVFQFISAKMSQPASAKKSKKPQEPDMQTSMQQSMIYTFPLFTLIFGLNFPSGLTLYWLLFSMIQAWQQYKMTGIPTSWKEKFSPLLSKVGLLKSKAN